MNPYSIIAALVASIALSVGSYYAGWQQRGDHEAAITLKAKIAADANLAAERKRGDGLATELEKERLNIKTVTIEIIKEVPKVTTVYKERENAPTIQIPEHIYTVGFVRLWNESYIPDLRKTPSKFADQTGRADDLIRAKVVADDILQNHIENAGKWAKCRADLNKLIDWHEGKPPAQ